VRAYGGRQPRTGASLSAIVDLVKRQPRKQTKCQAERMTDSSTWNPDLQPGDERTALEQRLDQYRHIVMSKLADLDDAQASTHVLETTDLTVGGIVKHLAWAEDRWFQERLLGADPPEPWASAPLADDPDWPFHSSHQESVEELLSIYYNACARSRASAALFDSLDAIAAVPSFGKGPVNLRWILVHMIEETARHAGHLDLLRDALDRAPRSDV
jgi:Protein of unknown function (DUF664)